MFEHSVVRYVTLNIVSCTLNLGLIVLLHEVYGLSESMSFGVALVVVFLGNFFALRHLVYPDSERSFFAHAAGYGATSLVFRSAEYVTFVFVISTLRIDYRAASLGVLAASYVLKQFVHRWVVFRPTVAAIESPETSG